MKNILSCFTGASKNNDSLDDSKITVRESAFVLGAFLVLACFFWGRYLIGQQTLFYDTLFRLFFPNAAFVRDSLSHLSFPFWNPHLYSGVPFLANIKSALFYPATYLVVFMDFPTALVLNMWGHSVLAGCVMYAFSRELGLSKPGAMATSVVYAFNGFFVMHYSFPSQFYSYAWLPLILLFGVKYQKTSNFRFVLYASIVMAFQVFAGHPQFVIYTVLILVVFLLSVMPWKKTVLLTGGVGGVALLLTSVQWIPALNLIFKSTRFHGQGIDWATAYSLHPVEFAVMLLGPLWNQYFVPQSGDPHIVGFYVGLPVLALCGFGLSKVCWRQVRVFWVLVCLGVFLSFGKYIFLYEWVLGFCPWLGVLRFPAQSLFMVCFGLSVAAGFGFDRLNVGKKVKWAFLGIIVMDLFLFSLKGISSVDRTVYEACTPLTDYFQTNGKGARLMMSPRTRLQHTRRGKNETQAWLNYKDSLVPNMGMAYGLYDADGYEELRFQTYEQILGEMGKDPLSPWLNVFSVRFILSFWDIPQAGFRLLKQGLIKVFENPHVLPRAYFVSDSLIMDSKDILSFVAQNPEHDFSRQVIFSKKQVKRTQNLHQPHQEQPGKAVVHVARYLTNFVELHAVTDVPGWVVLADTYDVGWTGRVNGEKVSILQANYIQRAVPVEPGHHVIELTYRPPFFFLGAWLSFIGFVLCLVVLRRKNTN